MSRERSPWWLVPAAALAAGLIGVLARTWRFHFVGGTRKTCPGHDGRVLFAFWHARMLPLVFTHRGLGAAVLVSRSRDGELITRVIERFGFVTARGSSTRFGREGALEMLTWAERGRALGVTPDGPRGPARIAKPGVVWLASATGLPVVPIGTAASHAWVARSWDGFRVPLPFARVVVAFGAPLAVPRDLDEPAAEAWRVRLEQAIEATTAEAARRVGGPA